MISRKTSPEEKKQFDTMLRTVFDALEYKGYDPITQLECYMVSEDPVYITTYNNARALITACDMEGLRRYLLELYFGIK